MDHGFSRIAESSGFYFPADDPCFMVAIELVPQEITGKNIPVPGNHGRSRFDEFTPAVGFGNHFGQFQADTLFPGQGTGFSENVCQFLLEWFIARKQIIYQEENPGAVRVEHHLVDQVHDPLFFPGPGLIEGKIFLVEISTDIDYFAPEVPGSRYTSVIPQSGNPPTSGTALYKQRSSQPVRRTDCKTSELRLVARTSCRLWSSLLLFRRVR